MKPSPQQLSGLLKALDPSIVAVLCFGPDESLVRERARLFGRQVATDLDDPFAVVDLSASVVADDTARLSDEASAIGLMVQRKLIRIADAADAMTPAVETCLDNPNVANLTVLQAGELPATSKLRKLMEAHPRALAVACYPEDGARLEQWLDAAAAERGLRLERAARDALLAYGGGARDILRSELDKLDLYTGGGSVTLDDVAAVCADRGEAAFDSLVNAVAGGRLAEAVAQLQRLQAEGEAGIAMLRALLRRIWQLREVRLGMARGAGAEAAVKALRPPVFWKDTAAVTAQAGAWTLEKLDRACRLLLETERAIKQSGSAGDLLAEHALLVLAHHARR